MPEHEKGVQKLHRPTDRSKELISQITSSVARKNSNNKHSIQNTASLGFRFIDMSDFPQQGQSGHIELIVGSMFSGKSSQGLARVRRYTAARLRCIILRYANDNRYSNTQFSTHDKVMADAVCSGINRSP